MSFYVMHRRIENGTIKDVPIGVIDFHPGMGPETGEELLRGGVWVLRKAPEVEVVPEEKPAKGRGK